MLNRDYWEVYDEELEELDIYIFKDTKRKEIKQKIENQKLYLKLIKFCIKHSNYYQPDYKREPA